MESYCKSRVNCVRTLNRQVDVGGVKIGGGAPIVVQSMTNTKTCDVEASVKQCIALAEAGCSILVCGTCLDHFGLLDKKQVGDTTNMLDIITSMQLADKIVRV